VAIIRAINDPGTDGKVCGAMMDCNTPIRDVIYNGGIVAQEAAEKKLRQKLVGLEIFKLYNL